MLRIRSLCVPLVALLCFGSGLAAGTVYTDLAAFLDDAGDVHVEDFRFVTQVGEPDAGAVGQLPFHGFRARSVPDALKVMDAPHQGNHGTSTGDRVYLTADTDLLIASATVTLEFDPPVSRVGFWVVDLDYFPLGVTVAGGTYSIPATGNGGQAFFGILGAGPIDGIVLEPLGGDSHYSIDDVHFDPPPEPEAAGQIFLGTWGRNPLTVDRLPGGTLLLSWGSSCSWGDDDFEVYEGVLGDFRSHEALDCSTGGARSHTVTPAAGLTYYLVVPRNRTREGSYGRASDGSPRHRPDAACLLQSGPACP